MQREEIRQVLKAFYMPDDPDYPGKYWIGNPLEAVREVTTRKNYKWNKQEIKVVGARLLHLSSTLWIEMMENIYEAEKIILDAIHTIKPAFWSTLVLHNVTFYLGVALILAAVYASYQGQDLFGAIMGGIGISDIIFLFFKQPIKGLQRSIGNLIQLEVIYNSYTKQLRFWGPFQRRSNVDIKREIILDIEKSTKKTIHLIEKYCKNDMKTRVQTSIEQFTNTTLSGTRVNMETASS